MSPFDYSLPSANFNSLMRGFGMKPKIKRVRRVVLGEGECWIPAERGTVGVDSGMNYDKFRKVDGKKIRLIAEILD